MLNTIETPDRSPASIDHVTQATNLFADINPPKKQPFGVTATNKPQYQVKLPMTAGAKTADHSAESSTTTGLFTPASRTTNIKSGKRVSTSASALDLQPLSQDKISSASCSLIMAPPSKVPAEATATTENGDGHDVELWLEVTGFHNQEYRNQTLKTYKDRIELAKKRKALENDLAELERQETIAAQEELDARKLGVLSVNVPFLIHRSLSIAAAPDQTLIKPESDKDVAVPTLKRLLSSADSNENDQPSKKLNCIRDKTSVNITPGVDLQERTTDQRQQLDNKNPFGNYNQNDSESHPIAKAVALFNNHACLPSVFDPQPVLNDSRIFNRDDTSGQASSGRESTVEASSSRLAYGIPPTGPSSTVYTPRGGGVRGGGLGRGFPPAESSSTTATPGGGSFRGRGFSRGSLPRGRGLVRGDSSSSHQDASKTLGRPSY